MYTRAHERDSYIYEMVARGREETPGRMNRG